METSTMSSDVFPDKTVKVLFCFGELFVLHQLESDGRFYCAVQLIGKKIEASKYKCEFTVRAANGIEQISKTLLVRGYSGYLTTNFNSGNCLRLDEVTVKYFKFNGKINLNITLSKV
jgi:hypothetical protein